MIPMTMPARAWLSPPSRPCEASMSLSALRPRAQANGETTSGSPQNINAPTRPTMPRIIDSVDCGWSGRGGA